MPDQEISQLTRLVQNDVAATDPLAIVDVSGSETKKVHVKDLVQAAVALIDNTSIPATKVGTLGTNQVATGAIVNAAVTNDKIETSTSASTGIDGGTKLRDGTVTVAKLDATKFDRGLTVANAKLGISNSITANTTGAAKVKYDAQGLITGTASLVATDLPKATASAIGAVSVPTNGKLAVDGNGAISIATIAGLAANSYTKVTVNQQGQVTGGTILAAGDLPKATVTAVGGVIAVSTGGLVVDASGNLSLATQSGFASTQTPTKVTVNEKGIVTGLGSLAASDIPPLDASKISTGTFNAARIPNDAITTVRILNNNVTNAKIETSTNSSTGIDGATKLRNGTVTAAKLNTTNIDRSLNVANGNLGINNAVTGGASTRSGISYNAQGLITQTVDIAAADLPEATASAIGAVSVGTGSGLTVTSAGAISINNNTTSTTGAVKVNYNSKGLITGSTSLTANDLPTATTSAKGAVKITTGGGLSVDGAGGLSTSASGVTANTYQSVTVNTKGVVTAGSSLTAAQIPPLDASKITTGSLSAARIGNDTIDGSKLSNTSTAIFQSIAQNGYPTAQFNGQILFDTVSEDAFIWDGNAWQAITTLTKGSLVFGGTYNANTSKMASTTTAGIAAGLAVGSNLPTPSATTDGVYVVVDVAGTPSAPAPVVSLSPPDYILGVTNSAGSSWNEIDLSQTVAGQVASNITFTPYGQLSSTNVQDALQELETEKMGLTGGTCTGQLLISNTGSLVFEGSTIDAYETTITVADPTSSDKTITFPDTTGTVITSGDTNTVTSTMVDASLVNANLAATAAIAFSKLAALNSAQILVGNGSNVATAVAVTGDIGINNSGLTSITAGAIVNADINASAAISGSKIVSGTTSVVGVVQLEDSTTSTSTSKAATPASVKAAKDAADAAATTANAAVAKSGSTMTGNLIIDNAKELRFSEPDADGAHYTGLKAQAQTADITLTLPAVAPTAGYILKANASTPTTLEWSSNGSTLTHLNLGDSNNTGTVAAARLGSGSSITTKFLRGDNTWQTVSTTPEGTAILSTTNGNEAATKYLRADGDGTCSWQSVPSSDLLNDTTPQLGGNLDVNGKNILFGDSSDGTSDDVLKFGAGTDLNLWSDGSVGIIQCPSSGGIHIGTATTENIIDVEPSQVVFNKPLVVQDADLSIRASGTQKILWDTSANAMQFQDDIQLRFGNTGDFKLSWDHLAGGEAKISSPAAWLIAVSNSGFEVTNEAENNTSLKAVPGGSVELYENNQKKLETTSSGVAVTGVLDVDGHVTLSDSDYLQLGDSQDLQLGNNGTNNFIQAANSLLQIVTSTDHPIQLKHNSTTRLATSSTGVAVTGALTVSGDLTVQGTTTTIDSTTLQVEDKNIEIGKVSTPTDSTADGGGLTLLGATNKTFNWVNSTDAWTSSEHIEVASGKTFIGNGSTLTSLDASNISTGTIAAARVPTLNQNTSGTAALATQFTVTANNSTDETVYPLFADGATGSQGAETDTGLTYNPSSGALTATSFVGSGANLTNLPAGGNSVDLVASGSIAAGKPVIIKSDGKVQQIGTVYNATSSNGLPYNGSQISSHTNMTSVQVAQNLQYTDWEVSVCGFRGASGAYNIYIQLQSFNQATGSNGSALQITYASDGLGNNIDVAAMKYMTGRNFFIIAVNSGATQSGSVGYSQLWSVSMNSSGTLTKHQKLNVSGRILDIQPIGVISNAYTLMVFRTDSSGVHIQAFTVDSSGNFTAGTTHSPSSTNGYAQAENGKMAWNRAFDRVGIAWVRASDEKAFVSCAAWSGTAFSWAAGSQLNYPNSVQGNDYGGGVAIACEGSSGKYVCTYQDSNQSKAVCVDPGTSGQNANPGTAITIDTGNPDGVFSICDNYGVDSTVVWAGWYTHKLGCANIAISGSNTLTRVGGVAQAATYEPNPYCNVCVTPEHTTVSNVTYLAVYIVYRYNSNWRRVRIKVGTPGTNITTNTTNSVLNYCNILGFAEAAISDGATGTIKLPGNVVGNQSSLTPGTFYYMQSSGALGTSADSSIYNIKAGIATSSTQLVIGDFNRL